MKKKCILLIALVAIAAAALSGCKQDDENSVEPQKKILLSGMSVYAGRTINLAISLLLTEKAYGEADITGDMALVPLKNVADDQPFTGIGPFTVGFTVTGGTADEVTYTGSTLILREMTAMTLGEFTLVPVLPNPPQKKITITDIPGSQDGKNITLTLLQSGTQKASASGTVSGTSATFNLMANSASFTGNGLFTVRFTVPGELSLTYETMKLITAETTTIPWTDFSIKAAN